MFKFFSFQKEVKTSFVQRANRLKLSPFKQMIVKIEGHPFKIYNISSSGLALFDNDDLIKTKTTRATIIYEGSEEKKYITSLEKIHHHHDHGYTGFKVNEDIEGYEKFVFSIFDIELQASQFRKLRDESVKQNPLGPSRWWEGGEEKDFYLVTNETKDKVLFFYLSFMGNVISMDANRVLFLGEVDNDEMRFERYQGSHTIVNPRPLTQEAKRLLLEVVCNLPKINTEVIDDLKQILTNNTNE